MQNSLVSVIVPIYQVEKYLDKCVESILNQTYTNLEIILVDDGSPDNCGKMCDEYVKKDNRIKVIHKPNGGLSDARNAAIEIAKGEFFAFVDSDDYIEPNYIEKLLNALSSSNCDIAMCYYNYLDEDGKSGNYSEPIIEGKFIDDRFDLLFNHKNIAIVVAWTKLYRKKIFEDIRYPVGKIHEDEFVIYDVLKNAANGIVLIPDKLYNYVIHQGSTMTAAKPSAKMLDGYLCAKTRVDKMTPEDKFYALAIAQYLNSHIFVYKKVKSDKSLKNTLRANFLAEYKKYKKYLGIKHKIKFWLFKYFPNLCASLI